MFYCHSIGDDKSNHVFFGLYTILKYPNPFCYIPFLVLLWGKTFEINHIFFFFQSTESDDASKTTTGANELPDPESNNHTITSETEYPDSHQVLFFPLAPSKI